MFVCITILNIFECAIYMQTTIVCARLHFLIKKNLDDQSEIKVNELNKRRSVRFVSVRMWELIHIQLARDSSI